MSTSPGLDGQSLEPAKAQRANQRLGRSQRITRSAVFRETYAQGRRYVGKYMVLWLRTGADASLRLGVVSSRKVGNAVQRNRARRLLREVFRHKRGGYSQAFDLILVARRNLLEARWPAIEQEFTELARRAGLSSEDPC
jgi:ribonuclease P protein component